MLYVGAVQVSVTNCDDVCVVRVGEQVDDSELISDAAQIADKVNTLSSSSVVAAATEMGAGNAELVASHSDAADVRLAGLPTASESSSIQILCGK